MESFGTLEYNLLVKEENMKLTSCYSRDIKGYQMAAKAQYNRDTKDFVEWGEETCWEHTPEENRTYMRVRRRKDCPECWQSLKQLVE